MIALQALLVLGIGVLAILSAAFSAAETAIFSMSEERRRRLRLNDPRTFASVESVLANPTDALNALLLVNAVVNLPMIVGILFVLGLAGIGDTLPGWLILAAVFALVVGACDLLPKLVALAAPVRTTRLALPLVRALAPVILPLCRALEKGCEKVVDRFAPSGMVKLGHLSDDELETLVEIGRSEGALGPAESGLIKEIMKLDGEFAKHCMTPRVDMFSIPDDLTNAEVAAAVQRCRYRTVPVRGETPDEILGLLDVNRFLLEPGIPFIERLRTASFVSARMPALELLSSFLKHPSHFAILVDEYGGIDGVVTLSDFIEELLGEEGPESANELYIEKLGPGRIAAAGGARLDDLAELTGWETDAIEPETIGGLVLEHLGFLPKPGVTLEIDGWRIEVRRATRKRIKEVLLQRGLPQSAVKLNGMPT